MRPPPGGGAQYGGPHSPPPAANSPPPSPSSSAITRSREQDLAAARLVVNLVQSRAISVNLGKTWMPQRLVNLVQSRSISAGPGCCTARRLPAPREARPRCTSLRVPYLQSIESSVPHTSRGSNPMCGFSPVGGAVAKVGELTEPTCYQGRHAGVENAVYTAEYG